MSPMLTVLRVCGHRGNVAPLWPKAHAQLRLPKSWWTVERRWMRHVSLADAACNLYLYGPEHVGRRSDFVGEPPGNLDASPILQGNLSALQQGPVAWPARPPQSASPDMCINIATTIRAAKD